MSHPDVEAEDTKTEKFLTNESGLKLFCKYWSVGKDAPKPRALLFIAHGIAEHCLYYEEIADLLTKEGFYVFAHDHQGHGKSEGTRVLIDDLRHYARDIYMHVDHVKTQFPDLPVFIIGHSMGGAITVLAALDRPKYFKGVALIAPLVIAKQESASAVRIFFGKILARLFPNCPVLWFKSSDISRDPAVVQKYDEDPLNYHGGVKAGTALAMLKATMEMESKLDTIDFPFFIIHGGQDRIVPPDGSKMMFEKAASKDKTLKMFEACFHQLHNEVQPDKTEAIQSLCQWLSKQVN